MFFRKEWISNNLGPATHHLRFEFFLLLSLTWFTTARLQGIYKDSFGRQEDYFFIALVLAKNGPPLSTASGPDAPPAIQDSPRSRLDVMRALFILLSLKTRTDSCR